MPIPIRDERITAEEFYASTGEERCELIDGVIYDMMLGSKVPRTRFICVY